MSTLLSAVSGQFAKMIMLGTMFPVVIISILNVFFVGPLLPAGNNLIALLKKVAVGDEKWAVVTLTFIVLVLTGVLYNLNTPIIRLYEGYPWKNSWLGKTFVGLEKKRFSQAHALRLSLRYLRRELLKCNKDDPRASALSSQQSALARYLNSDFPDQEEFVLPTRFGNVIRCFERYSFVAYGIDAIVLFPRIVAKIDSGFASTIDEAKISLNFVLNISFLSGITAFGIIAIGLWGSHPLNSSTTLSWVWRAAMFFILTVTFYRFSIGRAKAWGLQVKAAFDLYRGDLLKSLGYQQQPLSFEEERALWQRLSAQLVYADSRESPLPYKDPPSRAIVSPAGVQLVVTRRYSDVEPNGSIQIGISMENTNALRAADVVRLIETVPDGYNYVFYSARTSDGAVTVSGLKPLEFVCGPIAPAKTVVVTYAIKKAA